LYRPCLGDHDQSGILVNTGHLLANLVFIALLRTTPEIFYFKTKSGREVDFVVQGKSRYRSLVQVCESIVDPRTRKREIAALNEAMAEFNLSEGTVVTRAENEQI
jgi:predicted AAA+ superfamily ATPase